jgi:hypothetical protein
MILVIALELPRSKNQNGYSEELWRADQRSSYFAFALNVSHMQPPRGRALDLDSVIRRLNSGLPNNWVAAAVRAKDSLEQQKESERGQAYCC